MPSTRTLQHRNHTWTVFEQHALLCLICRQIPITGLPSPSAPVSPPTATASKSTLHITHKRKHKTKVALSKSIRQAHHDVADALNRALNFTNQEKDIPAEEVSAMLSQLVKERPQAVAYLERQCVGRITRAARRVWERAGRSQFSTGMASLKDCVVGMSGNSQVGVRDFGGDRVLDSIAVDREHDPWGDNVATSDVETEPDPWGGDAIITALRVEPESDPWAEEVAAYLVEAQPDPWGDDESMRTAAEVRGIAKTRSPIHDDSTINDIVGETDPWDSQAAPSKGNDTIDHWGDIAISSDVMDSRFDDSWADKSSNLASNSGPDFTSSQAQLTASVIASPKTFHGQDFIGINSERFAMLDASNGSQNEIVQKPAYIGRGMGENAIELPFNRIDRTSSSKKAPEMMDEAIIDAGNDESENNEEE